MSEDQDLEIIEGGVSAPNAVLKTLTMTGFKSFVHRTHLEFAPGITAVIGPNGSGKCGSPWLRVALADGSVRRLGDLVERAISTGAVEKIEDGYVARNPAEPISVISLDPIDLKFEERRVSAFVKRTSPEKLLRVRTRSGRMIEATAYHPLLTIERGHLRSLRADELRANTFVALPRRLPFSADRAALPIARTEEALEGVLAALPTQGRGLVATADEPAITINHGKTVRVPVALSEELAYFLGASIAEGRNSPKQLWFVNSDPRFSDRYQMLVRELFGLELARRDHDHPSAENLIISSRALTLVLEALFEMRGTDRSALKKVPSQILTAPEPMQWAFLSGLFEGDVHLCHKMYRGRFQSYAEYASASEELARGVVSLLLRLGVFASLRSKVKWASNTVDKTRRTYWSVYVYGADQLRVLGRNLRFAGDKQKILDLWSAYDVAGNPNLDVIPTATDLIRQAAKAARVSVKRNRKGRSKLAAYTQRRCHASRQGIREVSAQIEQLGATPEAARPILDRLEVLADSDVYWDQVVSVEAFDSPYEWVYDLCVDGFHNFVAEDMIVHNSNVADAIRWALGENNARILRAKKNEELIFGGSETRKSLSMAEAILQLDNTSRRLPIEFTEVEVGRRLFRNGEAEYLVNRSRVRLRDLQDLLAGANLADNPFVVIGQGLVDQILALRPSDRRTVIEEAAGTRRLQLRREEALNRLRHAEAEMVRVVDILREIGPRVETLREQAAKWNEYEAVRAELRRRALRWYKASFGTTAETRADLLAKIEGVDREVARLEDFVSEVETLAAGTDEELRAAREEEERRRLASADATAAEATVRERVAALVASLEAIAAERDRTRATLAALPAELASLRERRQRVEDEAAEAARHARGSADAARAAEEEASRTRVALAEARAARVEAERAHLLRENDEVRLADEERSLQERDEELARGAAELARERTERERERARLAVEIERARETVAEAARAAEAAASRAGAARNELQRIDGDLALLRGQTTALREAAERAEAELAARDAGAPQPSLPGGFAWLHQRIAVPDEVTAALGERVAVGDSKDAREASPPKGTRRLADGIAVFLAPDDAAAIAAAATLRSGVVVAPSGLMVLPGLLRHPDPRRKADHDARAQLRGMAARLREELAASERALAQLQQERAAAEARVGELEERLAAAQRARGDAERVVDGFATQDADVRDLVRVAEARATSIERERAELLGRRERLAAERASASAVRAQAGDAFAAAERAEASANDAHAETTRRAEAARLDAATSEERRSSLVRLRDTLDEQVAATEKRIADDEDRLRALAAQEREARARMDAAHSELGRATAEAHEADRAAELARQRALAAEGSRRESEQRLAKARERLAELRGERARLAVEEERASGALRLLEEQVRAELGLPDEEPLPDPTTLELEDEPDEKEKGGTLNALQRLRRRLIALEPVNPLAATELAEIGQRHEFLTTQKADLEKAMVDLRTLADELATTIAEQFSTTLMAVDREFGLFFQRLFNGGQASLRTSEDPDEPGIDIYARPPGKRIGSLQQLSGGERALTATALLLAILRVKPAPFCVLDEVDAALDERNVGRFTQALKELTDRTQFVVITHNRGTIEAADTIYGVSMDEGGVSKVISLKLSELDEQRLRVG
ncbi:MAG TPA: LAGLIDADG family homing endonuclease [Candidatus Limnocylindria bacterium]|nr:LAGLIDADG family homing endonuclease [Candidatus Limnocylindria bacterium]